MFLSYVKVKGATDTHMVLSYFESPNSEPLILDSLRKIIFPASKRDDLTPIYNFNPKLSAALVVSPRYFMQSADSYEDDKGEVKNNNNWRILDSAALKYSFNDYFALETTLGVYSKKKYNENMRHFQDYSTSFYLSLGSHFELNMGYRASDGTYDTREQGGFSLYNPDYSEYFAILTVVI